MVSGGNSLRFLESRPTRVSARTTSTGAKPIHWRKLLTLDGRGLGSEVDVFLHHGQGGMPQILLKQEHISSVQEKHRCIGMTDQMGMQPLDSRRYGQSLKYGSDGIWCQMVPLTVQKKDFDPGVSGLRPFRQTVVQQGFQGGTTEGNDPLLGPFTHHLDVLLLQVEVIFPESGHLHDPEAGVQHERHHCNVAGAFMLVRLNHLEDGSYLLVGQGLDDDLSSLGLLHVCKDVFSGVSLAIQPAEKAPQGVDPVVDGVGGDGGSLCAGLLLEVDDELPDGHIVDVPKTGWATISLQPSLEPPQHLSVPFHGLWGLPIGPSVDLEKGLSLLQGHLGCTLKLGFFRCHLGYHNYLPPFPELSGGQVLG